MKRRHHQQGSGRGGGGQGSSKHRARSSSTDDSGGTVSFGWRKLWLLLAGVTLLSLAVYCILPSDFTASTSHEETQGHEMADEEGEGEEGEWRETGVACERLLAEARHILSTQPRSSWESALDLLASCALQEPQNPKPRWNLAVALIQMERPQEALGFIDEALTLDRNNLDYLKSGGAFFSRMGYHEQAVLCLERFLELSLRLNSWEELLATISIQREDEWFFLYEADSNVTQIFELLLHSYLQQRLLIKAGYMYKVLIGLLGSEADPTLLVAFSLFSMGLGDLVNGVHYLRKYTEAQYVAQGYGTVEQAYEVVSAHSLRLFTAGFDSHVLSIVRNLLMAGQAVWEELVYNCQLGEKERVEFAVSVSQETVRRVFSRCVVVQGVIPALLQDGAVIYAENVFGWTPLLHAAALGSSAVVEQLLKHNADPEVRNYLAHTSLHIAAIRGSYEVVSPLIQSGIKASEVDYFNRTALQLACMHRWSARPMAETLQVNLPRGCPVEVKYEPPPKHSFQGGWLTSGIHLPHSLTRERCDFDVIPNTDVEQFLFDYLALQRPVLIRGGGSGQEMKPFLTAMMRNKLEQEQGDLVMREQYIPFAETFGHTIQPTTIKTFLDNMKDLVTQSRNKNYSDIEPPSFIFQPIHPTHPLLENFKLPAILNPNKTHLSVTDMYFHVGPALSGMPPHFHRASWTLLVYGETRWHLSPPPLARYTKTTAWEWWKEGEREGGECVQHAGDILVVPDLWGQASVNLRESVGLTSEFVYGASEFSI